MRPAVLDSFCTQSLSIGWICPLSRQPQRCSAIARLSKCPCFKRDLPLKTSHSKNLIWSQRNKKILWRSIHLMGNFSRKTFHHRLKKKHIRVHIWKGNPTAI